MVIDSIQSQHGMVKENWGKMLFIIFISFYIGVIHMFGFHWKFLK